MFPTSGFFRGHNCPYYLSGLCERPYCHFRHVKQEEKPLVHQQHLAAKQLTRRISESVRNEEATRPATARQKSESECSENSSGGAGDYTPTPLSILRRTKLQPQTSSQSTSSTSLSYEPTPLALPASVPQQQSATSSAVSACGPEAPVPRRRPLQLPAPKSGTSTGTSVIAGSATDDDIYDPMGADSTAGPSKRGRRHSPSPPPQLHETAALVDYEPTPIDSVAYGVEDGNDDGNDEEYCPTAVQPPVVPVTICTAVAGESGSGAGEGGSGIQQVFLDLFGEEPTIAPGTESLKSAVTAASKVSLTAPLKVNRLSPAEQLAKRAQQAAENPFGLGSQGKVRVAVSSSAPVPPPVTPLAGSVANKIPEVVRQRYLDRISEECRQTGASPDQAAKRAQQLELECHERSANRNVYLNAVILAIKRVRTSAEQDAQQNEKRKQPADSATQLSDKRLHKHFMRYALTEAQLVDNKFPPNLPPLPYSSPTNPLERLCVRCGAIFLLQQPQLSVPPGQCCYHYGRAYSRRMPGAGVQQIYSCCGGDLQAKGCSLAVRHVHEYNVYCDTVGYKTTQVPDKEAVHKKKRLAVFALDCEMVYTDAGKELARVTMIDRNLCVVYDRLVRPSAPIVDCNTRFSGLKEEQLDSAEHRLADVQQELMELVYSTCILVGHSLESDLQVLKLRHFTVVDTSVVFPHRQGPPKKRALRTLASEILNKIIQAGGDAGHDSSEDARTCMELMLNKITEDLKKGKCPS